MMFSSLRIKILSGFGFTLLLAGIIMLRSISLLSELGDATASILQENYKSILAAEGMINTLERQDSAVLLAELGDREMSTSMALQGESMFLQWLALSKDNITIEGERGILETIESNYLSYRTLLREESRNYKEAIYPAFVQVRKACIELRELNQATMFQASERAEALAAGAVKTMSVLGLVFISFGFGFSLFISLLISRPLKEMIQATGKIARGEYDISIKTGSRDELGQLANSFNEMSAKLKRFHELNIGEILFEKRRSEAVIRSIDDGIVLVNDRLEIVGMNPAAEKILSLHFKPNEPLHFFEAVRDDDVYQELKAVASGSREEERDDYRLYFDEKGKRHYNYSVTPVLVGKKILGTVLVLRDVTRLKEVDRLKSEFIATASHELRTPLTSISMSIDLLKESMEKEQRTEDLETVTIASEELARLRQLLSDLLDLSRIEAGKIELEILPVSAGTILEQAAAHLGIEDGTVLDNGARFSISVEDSDIQVYADISKTIWIVSNLITNSIKYAQGAHYLKLSIRQGREYLFFSLSDDGPGIPPDFSKRIFDKFVRVGGASDPGGTGLGLSICREIIRAQHGTIWYEENREKGATFTFTLPLVHTREKEVENEQSSDS